MRCTIGLDVSTSATKAFILDENGRVLGSKAAPHPVSTPRPLWSEQDPEDWYSATCEAIRAVLGESGVAPGDVVSVGLSGQMHGLVLLGRSGEVLRPCILWNDQRASEQCDVIRSRLGLERLVRITGNDAFPGFTAPKLLWVREHEPDIYEQIHQVLLPKDYVRYRLTGSYATDRAGAGGTLLLDLGARDWSPEMLEALEIPGNWLPPTHEGVDTTGQVSALASKQTGLVPGTPVVAGAGDQAAQAIGVGATTPDIYALTIGTSGVVFAPCDRPTVDPLGRAHAFPHAIPGLWHVMGVMLSAAGSLDWYRRVVAPNESFDALVDEAAEVAPGSEGLMFLPYLSGERTPHADPNARGAFVGLSLRHGRGHLTRAVLEGVAFGLRDNFSLLRDAGLPTPREIRASGGALKSPIWSQLLADVLGAELVPLAATEGAALGAAQLAGVGVGMWPDVTAAAAASTVTASPIKPDPESSAMYEDIYGKFREHYPAIAPLFSG